MMIMRSTLIQIKKRMKKRTIPSLNQARSRRKIFMMMRQMMKTMKVILR
jgi:hypothetical protein